jgi:hypothetical protein
MIENLRKYTGLMIVVFVILFISFFFLDSSSVRNMSSGRAMLKIAGRTYDDKELQNLGKNSLQLAYGLAGSGDFEFIQFASLLSNGEQSDQAPEKFFIGRMILRQAKEEFGVYPGDDEITAYLRTLKVFAGPDQKFNAESYRNFVEKGMGRLGMTEKDLRDLTSDVLAFKKINAIVGAGLTVDRDSVTKNLALQNQQITGELAKLELAPFEEKLQPSEDEIRKFWENIQDSFTTEPLRKFTYIVIAPDPITEAKTEADAPESLADAAASDEVKKAAAKKKEEERAKAAAANAEARRTNQLALDGKVDDFLFNLEQQKGAGFEELAKANGWEIKTTELFTRANPPKELDLDLRSSSSGGKTADQLFKVDVTSDPFSKISSAIAVGENQWVVARLDGEEKSRAKTFEEARAEARAQYISEKAAKALKAAATENITKIKTLLAAGKSFADAAKEVGIPETKAFTAITSTYRPDGASEPQNLFEASRYVDPGTIAEVITESERAFILYVAKREVVKEANAIARIDSEVATGTRGNETYAFSAWISARTDDAKVEQLYKN